VTATNTSTNLYLYPSTSNIPATTGIIKYKNVMLTTLPYQPPFVDGTRGETHLYYPYDLVNLSQDFTVMGWWKPYTVGDGTYNPAISFNKKGTNVTSSRILIMDGSTTTNRLCAWVGSGSSETTFYAPSSPGIQTGRWNFFAFIRTGTTLKLWHGVNGSIGCGTSSSGAYLDTLWSGNGTTTFIDSNWGWIIGQYASGGVSMGNGYYRDYSFIQSALSDTDIQTIYKTQMRAYKDGSLQVQGQIKEGVVL
jgi:hypothetical protein